MILGYLLRYGSIDRYRAMTHFDVWDLPKIISTLRRQKHDIISKGRGKHLKYTISQIADKYKTKQEELLPASQYKAHSGLSPLGETEERDLGFEKYIGSLKEAYSAWKEDRTKSFLDYLISNELVIRCDIPIDDTNYQPAVRVKGSADFFSIQLLSQPIFMSDYEYREMET